MAILAEAIRALTASCNIGVVGVAVVAVFLTRGSLAVLGAVVSAGVIGGWLLAADVAVEFARVGGTVVHVVVLVGALVGVFVLRHRPPIAAGIAGFAELLTTVWWRPCVGLELAKVLNRGPDDFLGAAFPMALYMLGLLIPAIAAAALMRLILDGGHHQVSLISPDS